MKDQVKACPRPANRSRSTPLAAIRATFVPDQATCDRLRKVRMPASQAFGLSKCAMCAASGISARVLAGRAACSRLATLTGKSISRLPWTISTGPAQSRRTRSAWSGAAGLSWPAAYGAFQSLPAARPHPVQMRALQTTGGYRRRKAGRESHPAQGARSDEDPPSAEGRRRLLQRSRVHPPQRRYEPPLGGVPSWLARPCRQRPTITPG